MHCFQFRAILNKATWNVYIHISFHFTRGKYLGNGLMGNIRFKKLKIHVKNKVFLWYDQKSNKKQKYVRPPRITTHPPHGLNGVPLAILLLFITLVSLSQRLGYTTCLLDLHFCQFIKWERRKWEVEGDFMKDGTKKVYVGVKNFESYV